MNCGGVFLCFAPNDAGQPRAQTGEKLIGDGARRLSCCFGGEHGVAIPADERGGISRADIGDLRHIRQKLGDDARYIETIRGVGYKFNDKQENRL